MRLLTVWVRQRGWYNAFGAKYGGFLAGMRERLPYVFLRSRPKGRVPTPGTALIIEVKPAEASGSPHSKIAKKTPLKKEQICSSIRKIGEITNSPLSRTPNKAHWLSEAGVRKTRKKPATQNRQKSCTDNFFGGYPDSRKASTPWFMLSISGEKTFRKRVSSLPETLQESSHPLQGLTGTIRVRRPPHVVTGHFIGHP